MLMSCMLICYWVAASVRSGPALRGSTPHALRAGTPRCSEPALPRRAALQLAVAAVASAAETPQVASARETGRAAPDRAYGPLLQGPFDFPSPGSTRATLRKELVPGRIWSFEQVQLQHPNPNPNPSANPSPRPNPSPNPNPSSHPHPGRIWSFEQVPVSQSSQSLPHS